MQTRYYVEEDEYMPHLKEKKNTEADVAIFYLRCQLKRAGNRCESCFQGWCVTRGTMGIRSLFTVRTGQAQLCRLRCRKNGGCGRMLESSVSLS